MTMKLRPIAFLSGALATMLVLAGCTNGADPLGTDPLPNLTTSADGSTAFNSADEMFASGMIPHHQQAVEMADTILGKDGIDVRVMDLAWQIKAAQAPEIATMKGWLTGWGINYDDSNMDGMEGMDHGDGMMSQADMDQLVQATGVEASRLFLTQMIEHHQGALAMAQAEVGNGANPAAVDLAAAIVGAQTAEIATMQDILSTL